MSAEEWMDVGAADELAARAVQPVLVGRRKVALTCHDGEFGAISHTCNHAGGPLGDGHLDGDYLDICCHWLRQREIGAEGAVLVRPDRFVGWRSLGATVHSGGRRPIHRTDEFRFLPSFRASRFRSGGSDSVGVFWEQIS